jgi:Spy/CpxP family protein refolding chaperone
MRFLSTAIVIALLSLTCSYASTSDEGDSATALAALHVKADQAQPRDRCFLYAELVSQMTDLAGKQFNSGESGQASQTIQLVQQYAEKIHAGITDDSKKLRDAELLMRRASFRLKGILSAATYEDRPALEVTLKQLNEVQSELLMQVFKK